MKNAISVCARPRALVIGAGDMGMAVARRFGQRHRVLLADIDAVRLEAVATQLRDEGSLVETVVCDVTSDASVAVLAERVCEFGALRAMIHVAGLSPSLADWRTIMRVNLVGPRRVADAMLQQMAPGGAAVFVASMAAHAYEPTESLLAAIDDPLAPVLLERLIAANGGELSAGISYSLSKLGLIRMCRNAAATWGEYGVRIVSVSPGLIDTRQGRTEFANNPGKRERLAKTPLRRLGSLHEIVDAIAYLASDAASFVSGTDLLVDGGLSAATKRAAAIDQRA